MDRDDDYEERRSRRASIMEERLRHARGEELDDDDDLPPPRRSYGRGGGGFSLGGGGGCAQAILYLVLGGLAALLIAGLFFNQAMSSIGDRFGGLVPDMAAALNTPTPEIITGAAVVQQVRQLSRLETSSYTIERVVEINQPGNIPIDFLFGDKILLIARGNVVAGVDLSRLSEEDVVVAPDGSSITVRLPPAEIFSSSLDNTNTRVYSRDQGFLANTNQNLETLARQEAERQILAAACEGGVMQAATDNAVESVRRLLSISGFEAVTVQPSTPAACQAPNVAPAPTPAAP